MKKVAVVLVFVMFCFSAVYAKDPGRLFGNVFGGYTTVSMGDVNADIDADYDAETSFPDRSKQNAETGFVVGADLGLIPWGGLMVTLRGEYIGGIEGSYKRDPEGTEAVSMKPVLIPVMAGVKYELDVPTTAFFISAGIFGGYGIADVAVDISSTGIKEENKFRGEGFVAEAAGEFGLRTSESASFAVTVLYRTANIAEVKAAENTTEHDEGDIFQKDAGGAMEMDFSGLAIGGSMLIRF